MPVVFMFSLVLQVDQRNNIIDPSEAMMLLLL
jgi:hypothetical protein